MPPLPWTTIIAPDPSATYVGFATKLPLTRHRYIPGFMGDANKVRKQLATAAGLIGYSLLAQLTPRTFWTVSVWASEEQLRVFAAGDPHRSITRRRPERMGQSKFLTFPVTGSELPLGWDAVRARLAS